MFEIKLLDYAWGPHGRISFRLLAALKTDETGFKGVEEP